MSTRTSNDICKDINACSTKLAAAEKRALDLKDTRRQFIQELKDGYSDIWLKEVKEKCQIGRAMAYRILQLPKPENTEDSGDGSLLSRRAAPTGEVVTVPAGEVVTMPAPRELKTPKEVAADAMVMLADFLERHNVDLQATRAELINLLTEAQTGAAGDDPYRIPDDLSIPSSLRRDQAPPQQPVRP
jgi:hypothetical protein